MGCLTAAFSWWYWGWLITNHRNLQKLSKQRLWRSNIWGFHYPDTMGYSAPPGVLPIFQLRCDSPRYRWETVGSDLQNLPRIWPGTSCPLMLVRYIHKTSFTNWHRHDIFGYGQFPQNVNSQWTLQVTDPPDATRSRRGSNPWAKFAVCWLVEGLWRRLRWYIPPTPATRRTPIPPIPSPPCIVAPESLARPRVSQWSIPCLQWCDRLLHIGALDLLHLDSHLDSHLDQQRFEQPGFQ